MSTSQPTCLLSKPLSWHDRRCSTTPKISMQLSQRLRGEASRTGCWYQQKTEQSILTLSGGTPHELKATRSKSKARAMRCTSRDRRRSQLLSRKLHRTLGDKLFKLTK